MRQVVRRIVLALGGAGAASVVFGATSGAGDILFAGCAMLGIALTAAVVAKLIAQEEGRPRG